MPIEALEQDSCAACGAQATWNPDRQALVCSYCGTEAPAELDQDTSKVREIDLVSTLREMPESLRGWQAEKRSVRCGSCNAISVFDPQRVGQNCDFCGSPELVNYDEIRAPLRPQSVLPFKVSDIDVRESIGKWYAGKWLAPSGLSKAAKLDTVKGIYLPFWTFDAQVDARWSADSGEYYYTTRMVRDSKGRMRSQQVRHLRWRPASGQLSHFFDDEPIPGSHGVHRGLLEGILPFPTQELVPYDTAYLSGFVVEHYQVVLIDAARQAKESMDEQLRKLCGAQVPGDTYRNLRVDSDYGGRTFKHILVPAWLLAYNYGTKSYQVVVNGYTGRTAGEYPKSWWKIAFIVLAVLCVLLAIFASQAR